MELNKLRSRKNFHKTIISKKKKFKLSQKTFN